MADIKNPERQGFESSGEEPAHGERFREQAGEAAEKTREAASAARDRVSEQAYNLADQGKQRLADAINDIAVSIREAGHKLHEEQQEGPAGYVDSTADQVERMARYLQQRDVEELYQSIENTARQHPAVFIGATFAVGLVAARFLRSSAGRRQQHAQSGGQASTSYGGSSATQSASSSGIYASSPASDRPAEREGSPSPGSPSNIAGPYPPESSQASQPPTHKPSEGGEDV